MVRINCSVKHDIDIWPLTLTWVILVHDPEDGFQGILVPVECLCNAGSSLAIAVRQLHLQTRLVLNQALLVGPTHPGLESPPRNRQVQDLFHGPGPMGRGDVPWERQKWDVWCSELTCSLREPGGPCTTSMEVSESHMERVKRISTEAYVIKHWEPSR